jgi:hypothetical protein
MAMPCMFLPIESSVFDFVVCRAEVLMHGLFDLCRYFVIANAIAAAYNLVVLLVRCLILRRRTAGLVVHMLDMVRFSLNPCVQLTHHGIYN